MTPPPIPSSPRVLHPLTLSDLLSLLFSLHPRQTTVIICLSQPSFIRLLLTHLTPSHPLIEPTINNLTTSTTTQLLFCDTVQSLQALLAVYPWPPPDHQQQHSSNSSEQPAVLLLIYPLHLHSHTPSHSVQGLSRTFASAVEASIRAHAQLLIVEPIAEPADDVAPEDPWAQHVPMLSPSSSKFSAGERAWVGRTVPVGRLVGRWCVFESLGGRHT